MPNYSYVADAHYKPYSFQEMLAPLTLYKQESDKREQEYLDYADRMDAFRQMAEDNPDSYAAQIYNNYSNDYQKAYNDYIEHGLNVGNKNDWLNLKRRYKGEIGRLETANQSLQEEIKRRRENKDTSMLYGNNNLTLDDFLDNREPNLYKISGNELMSLGQEMGKAISQRRYRAGEDGSIMSGQYNIFKETQGISPEELGYFMQTEGTRIADSILAERGAAKNLSGDDYLRARQSVLNGLYSGIVYNESNKPMNNGEYMTAAQRDASARAWRNQKINEAESGITWVNGEPIYNPDNSIKVKQAEAIQRAKNAGKSSSSTKSSSGSGSNRVTQAKERLKIKWTGNNPESSDYDPNDIEYENISNDDTAHSGTLKRYSELPEYAQKQVDTMVEDGGDPSLYLYYFKPYKSGGIWNDQEAELEIVPQNVRVYNNQDSSESDDLSSLFGAIGN